MLWKPPFGYCELHSQTWGQQSFSRCSMMRVILKMTRLTQAGSRQLRGPIQRHRTRVQHPAGELISPVGGVSRQPE